MGAPELGGTRTATLLLDRQRSARLRAPDSKRPHSIPMHVTRQMFASLCKMNPSKLIRNFATAAGGAKKSAFNKLSIDKVDVSGKRVVSTATRVNMCPPL